MKKFILLFSVSVYSLIGLAQLSIPVPTSPPDSADGVAVNAAFTWSASIGGLVYGYEAEISLDQAFTNPISVPTIGTAGFTDELEFNQRYFWRARAIGAGSVKTGWSTVRSFTTFYNDFDKVGPIGSGIPTRTVVEWIAISGVDFYQYQVDTSTSFTNPYSQTLPSTFIGTINLDGLTFDTEYYWRLRAYHSKDTSGWSSIDTFITINEVELSSPGLNAINRPALLELSCKNTAGVIQYRFEADTSVAFNANSTEYRTEVLNDADFKDDIKWTVERLKFNKQYYWRVQAINSNGQSGWSETRNFTTISKVNLKSPGDGTVGVAVVDSLKWDAIKGTEEYEIQIDNSPSFGNPLFALPKTNYITLPLSLKPLVIYHWRVRSAHANDVSDWSDVWSFEIHPVGIDENLLTRALKVYPNPAEDRLFIQASGELTGTINASIYDISGKLVLQENFIPVSNGKLNDLSIGNLNPGLYTVSLSSNNEVATYRIVKK